MNMLIVYAHPEPCLLIAALNNPVVHSLTALRHNVQVSDLYATRYLRIGIDRLRGVACGS